MAKKWKKMRNNWVLRGEGFFVSYNPDTGANPIGSLITELGNLLGGELEDGEETALVLQGTEGRNNVYSILTGDWRKEYEELVDKGYEACYEFFKSKVKEHGNNYSTREQDR